MTPARAGMASGVANSFFPLGTAAAIAAFGTLFSGVFARRMSDAELVRTGVPAQQAEQLRAAVTAGRTEAVQALPPALAGRVGDLARATFAQALADVCVAASVVCALAVLVSLTLVRARDLRHAAAGDVPAPPPVAPSAPLTIRVEERRAAPRWRRHRR
ncbi:hypothetical protein [Actinomadura sp. 3N407]|uniref:hypothetical protein n=1 Tax=Actinomadura sp. 3N407 TaxID=3457423 RepID=UPI003FCE4C61